MSRNLGSASQVESSGDVARLQEVEALRHGSNTATAKVTFTVGRQSLLFLVGSPGSGKSAILDLLCFQALPSKGQAMVLGADPARLSPSERPRMRRRVGLMFQDQRLLPDLNVFENVALAARVADRRPRDYAGQVAELLVWVGLGGRRSEPISRLTEGERRRLCLARALVNQPELLVADDPTAGLSAKATHQLLRLIAEVNAAGTPVVLATRDRTLAQIVGGRVYDIPTGEVP